MPLAVMRRMTVVLQACVVCLAVGSDLGPTARVRLEPAAAAWPGVATVGDATLAGATVYEATLDRQGRLWAVTQDGAFMLEGREWKPLPLPSSLTSHHVRTLLQGSDGALWLGTESAGILRLQNNTWTVWDRTRGLPVNRINQLLEVWDPSGRPEVWAATAGGGVLCFRQGGWVHYGQSAGLADDWVWKLRTIHPKHGAQELWAATKSGISVFKGEAWSPLPQASGQPVGMVNDLLQMDTDAGTEIWASCWGRGLVRWDGLRWEEFGPSQGFPSRNPTALALTTRPKARPLLWAATYDSGLASFDGKAWHHYRPGRELPGTGVYTLCPNPAGQPTLWAGTRGLGLLSLNLGGWHVLDEHENLPSPEINCFAEFVAPGGDSTFWFGTSNGILRWEKNGRRVVGTSRQGFPSSRVNTLLALSSPRGTPVLWAGTIGGLAYQDDGPWHLLGPKEGLPMAQVFFLLATTEPDGERTLWAGMEFGLARRRHGVWSVLTTADGLPKNWVHALAETRETDGSSVLWAATRGGGVACLRHGHWTVVNAGLPNLDINSLKVSRSKDGRQWLWAGSGGGGLARLDASTPGARWVTFASEPFSSLPSTFFYRLELDIAGRLYASTARGILRFDLEEVDAVPTPVRVVNYTLGDGLPNLGGIWFPSSIVDHVGRVWFGTPKGAVVLDPAMERPPAPVQIPHLITFTRGELALPFVTGMALGRKEQREVFEFGITPFLRPEDTRYRTQLVGLESQPGPWYPEGRRELAGLAPGRYLLKVWARDFLGRVSDPLELPFRITPSPWMSPWALGVYALLLAGGLLFLHRLRILLLRKRNDELERLVNLRTEDLRNTLAEVKTLRGLIPICMKCKRIRDYAGFWSQLESYLSKHSEARFSHGYCPECNLEARKELEDYQAKHPMP